MSVEQLLEWTAKQPAWAQDAIRRQAGSPAFVLNNDDKSAVSERIRHAAGFASATAPAHLPLTAENLQIGPATAKAALLCSLGPVSNLGRLAADQKLSFALDGVTLIYGDNGSGKSGYCRITKKICRSLTVDELLGDIFTEGSKPPAEVLVRYRPRNAQKVIDFPWKDGEVPPEGVRNISVFDSRNARLYVDKQNRIGFLPALISLLERHGALRSDMEREFAAERKTLETGFKVALPSGFTPGGKIAELVGKLAAKDGQHLSQKELSDLATWSDADAQELAALEVALAADPGALAQRCKRAVAALEPWVALLAAIENDIGNVAEIALAERHASASTTAAAAAVAAEDAFAAEPLTGVGKDPWRQMYDHAKAYIASITGAEELPSAEGDPCGLCQQPLSSEASARLQRFSDFVAGAAAKEADAARAALAAATKSVSALALPLNASVTQSLSEYRSMSAARDTFGQTLAAYAANAAARKAALVVAASNGDFSAAPALGDTPTAMLNSEISALKAEQQQFEDQAKGVDSRAKDIARRDELKDKSLLNKTLETFDARLVGLETYKNLKQCSTLVGTQQLSTLITAIRRKMITEGLEKRIKDEIDGLDLAHIPFAVSDQSKDGNSLFEVSIDAPVSAPNDKILSEGEQRALALACFLAEVAPDTDHNGLVIDDPVSSLDHLRIRRVARRMVAEAKKGRQVIIFTHNLVFYNEVLEAAAQEHVSVARRLIAKTESEGFGVVTEEDVPWIAKRTKERIEHLRVVHKKLEEFADYNTDLYRKAVRDFYTELRETWERLVEELLLGRVVERFESGVKTQSLKMVSVENEDYTKVYFAMARASERSGHDMATGKNIAPPKPDEIKADIDTISEYRAALRKRADALAKVREALEAPPKAEVG